MPLHYISSLLRPHDPIIVDPYGGYANDRMIHSTARVLEDEGIEHEENDGVVKNIWNSFKRFESDEYPDMPVKADWGADSVDLISDDEGYVHLDHAHGMRMENEENVWLPVSYRLNLDQKEPFTVTTAVLKPGSQVEYGVISDIDDTIIHTGVSSAFKWRLLVNSIASHAHKRRPLEGAAGFYTALHKGISAYNTNPIFYISNSPWNIHRYLMAFLQYNDFPRGPLILRDIGGQSDSGLENGAKYRSIVKILESYPQLEFVLIGDAAEVDTDIYLKIALNYPRRVKCIYIRAVDHKKRMRRVEALIEQRTDISVKLLTDSNEGIRHARGIGLIR